MAPETAPHHALNDTTVQYRSQSAPALERVGASFAWKRIQRQTETPTSLPPKLLQYPKKTLLLFVIGPRLEIGRVAIVELLVVPPPYGIQPSYTTTILVRRLFRSLRFRGLGIITLTPARRS